MASKSHDTEITLGTGKMLGLFFGLVIVCGVFFGLGFTMGHGSAKAKINLLPTDIPAPATLRNDTSSPAVKTVSSDVTDSPVEKPEEEKPEAGRRILLNGSSYVVQVAAVSKEEDADALVSALKKKQYSVFLADNKSQDALFHIQIGPFGELKDAEAMKSRLAGDGYNAIVKR